jgi:hypothetical protein
MLAMCGFDLQSDTSRPMIVARRLAGIAHRPERNSTSTKEKAMYTIDIFEAAALGFFDLLGIPAGLKGYEGQPGHQGGSNGGGLRGYEGQPGNQGG